MPMTSAVATPGHTRIGWVGLGVMGSSMAAHLLEAGYELTLHTRTRGKADGLLARGAAWAESPEAVATVSDVVFSMLGYPAEVREVVLGPQGILGGLPSGGIVVDMTTSEPALAEEVATAAAARGAAALDAPVSGGDSGAREARLSIMVGGDDATFQAVLPCLECMGKTIVLQGGPGTGQHTKMVNQTLIASTMVGVCEALLYAHGAGLDPERVLDSVSSGAAGSWSLSNLAPRILEGDFEPGFYVEHFVKDMGIALEEARRRGLELPGLALARGLYAELVAQGGARQGTQALVRALAARSKVNDWPRGHAFV
jgi:3-hydroxyisobutyrate dehydrogenase